MNGFGRIVADYFSHYARRKSRPKPQTDTD
jgi:hypothetical protein